MIYPKPVQEEINILANISMGIRHQTLELSERAEEFIKIAAIYDKMAQLLIEFDWKEYGQEEANTSGVL